MGKLRYTDNGFIYDFEEIVPLIITPLWIESYFNPSEKIQVNAMWDTGMTKTSITPKVISKLGLKCVSKDRVFFANGESELSDMYKVNIYLPDFKVENVDVGTISPDICDLNIGMNIITRGDFTISNYEGKTTMSFRIPSKSILDFSVHSYLPPIESPKVSRNAPCPCGSGKKYKHCCYGG